MERSEVKRLVSEVVDRLVPLASPALAPTRPHERPAATHSGGRARWVIWSAPSPSSPPVVVPPPPQIRQDVSRVVAVGADHGAYRFKEQLVRYLRSELRWTVVDCGTHSEDAVDYPDVARDVALAVTGGRASRGIVLDAMGIGSAMAANRVPGALCAVCHDEQTVRNAREHNDANLLSMGSRVVNPGQARKLVRLFLQTPHAGGRHARRVAKIHRLDEARFAPRGA